MAGAEVAHAAIANGDHDTLTRSAHTLKGASMSTGAIATTDLAHQLEIAKGQLADQPLLDLAGRLEASLQAVVADANRFIAETET